MERIKLDLVPGCVKPILRASQYDNGREWTCDILDNGVPYKFVSGDTCEIHVRKGDNCAVTASVPVTVGQSYVVVTGTEQMCAVSGDNLAELVIMNGTKKIGSCNLILSVEADPLNGSKSSASEIHDLQAQVNECVDEALSHKGASDIAFDNTDTGLEATNVQSAIEEVNTKTDEKANADDVYDKTYIDNAFTGVNNSLNTKMDKANPTGTGSFSLNRKADSIVGENSVAMGTNTRATGTNTTALGNDTIAYGTNGVAMGNGTTARDENAVAMGMGTRALGKNQFVFGKYNSDNNYSNYVEIVGKGNVFARSNARTLDWSGNEVLAGDLTYNGNKSITSEVQRLDDKIDNLPEPMVFKGTLGVGGTIQSLPTASAENEGWMFKCITEGTYAGLELKVGDTVTCFNPPNTSNYYWDKTGSQDTDTDTWRNIKVNGVEKLGNGISSGSLDVVDTDNIEAEFDNDGNKLKIKTKNIYTESEVDTLIANAVDSVLPTDSVSKSAIATFETDLAKPIELKAYIEAVQASGTPTPSTPLPIGGWDSVRVVRCGKNLFDQDTWFTSNGYTKNDDGSYYKATNPLNVTIWENKSGYSGQITLTFQYKYVNGTQIGFYPIIRYTDGTQSIAYTSATTVYATRTITSTSGKTVKDIKSSYGTNIGSTIKEFQIELGTVSTTYEAYNGTEVIIPLGQTVYGGYVTQDKAGHRELVITHAKETIDLSTKTYTNQDGYDRWNYTLANRSTDVNSSTGKMCNVCNRYAYESFSNNEHFFISQASYAIFLTENTYRTGTLEIRYPLETPIIIPLADGEPLNALIGTNNLFADSGDIECSFKCGVAIYVDNHSGGGNRSVNLAKSVEEEVKEEETKDEPLTRQER